MNLYACKAFTFCSGCQNVNSKVTGQDYYVPSKPESKL